MFSESGLLKTLDDDSEDLHGLGGEALMPMFDEYLGRATPKDHTLIRATLVPAIVTFLAAHYHVTENDAMGMFYCSKTAEAFADDDLGLYGQSALNLAGDVIQERNKQ